ncbi:MAG: DUF4177 domain-containing protein [Candidatus Heimdallarchaeota archaeon]|nr:DUF4177 domain-containing protein [Candidatus Heimdallarchaeota archaeon]
MKIYSILPPPMGKGYTTKIEEILNEKAREGWELHTLLEWAIVLEKDIKE